MRAYQEANAARIRARMKKYKRAYYKTSAGKATIQRANQKWNRSPAGRLWLAMAQQQRRAKQRGLPATFTEAEWESCREWFGNSCAYCGKLGSLHQEHVLPVQDGGPYSVGNIVPACGSCNSSKATCALDVWFPRQPFYTEERMMMIVTYLTSVGSVEQAS